MNILKEFDLYKFLDDLDNSYPDVDKHTFDSDMEYTSYRDGYTAGLNQAAIYAGKITDNLTVRIPKYISEWLEVCKENLAINLSAAMTPNVLKINNQPAKTINWFESPRNQETFAKAWLYGYNTTKDE